MWEWFLGLTAGWSRLDYISIIVVLIPAIFSLTVITVITHNWHKRFLKHSDVTAHVVFWSLFGLFIGVGALLFFRYLLPPLEIDWLEVIPH